MTVQQGIYTMSAQEYHSDPAPVASFSRSIAKLMIEASPAHVYALHPRLGGTPPTGAASGDDDMDVGTAAHALFLEGSDKVVRIEFDSYRTNAARQLRDEARAAGLIPLKPKAYDAAMRVVEVLEDFRAKTGLFTNGQPEQTVIWDEGDHWSRCRVDWLPDDPSAPLLDLKTTGSLLGKWPRMAFDFGADIQAALYPRGLEFVRGEAPADMVFVVCETMRPYGVRLFELDRIAIEIGQAKAAAARAAWVQCMQLGQWPGYSLDREWILPPPWVVQQWQGAQYTIGRATEDTAFIEKMIRLGNWGG